MQNNLLPCIIGPTASGKTQIAVALAETIDGEIISADSRQVYRGMNIGTGKDLTEYEIKGKLIPFHLIDMVEPGYRYNIFEYQRDFYNAYQDIINRNRQAILCGGSGMYITSVLDNYRLEEVKENKALREKLDNMSTEELINLLMSYTSLHNHTDTCDRERLIRAIEIQDYYKNNPEKSKQILFQPLIFYIHYERDELRKRITNRLHIRLQEGMIEEVEALLKKGVPSDDLIYYGLEYKYLTLYLINQLTYDEMVKLLNTAIHQFAKRQRTWFRGMQRKGYHFHVIDGNLKTNDKLNFILTNLKKAKKQEF
ncbi:MAG TPA: tRNA (adenosine(37)-N6)-dimethylallyltransferase MiaA [Bacteroidales bacterium]|nr:tRNA (adenosine(37)-N6)-dimethylallyltransferase MiaA [Bacteroidales bacterium]